MIFNCNTTQSIRSAIAGVTVAVSAMAGSAAQADYTDVVTDAIAGWNTYYGTNVVALDWVDEGILATEADRLQAVADMTDTSNAWMPSGDEADPDGMTAYPISFDPTIEDTAIQSWTSYVDGLVEVGHRRLRVDWLKDGAIPFSTVCVVDSNTIIYDSMFSETAASSPQIDGKRCLDIHLTWVWQMISGAQGTRGHIYADNNPKCRNGVAIACDTDCDGWMTAGQAECNCKSVKVGTDCCKMSYNYAWACGFKKVKVGADGYTLEVEGIIGSSGKGQGSCTVCCDELVAVVPGNAGMVNTLVAQGFAPGDYVYFFSGTMTDVVRMPGCPEFFLGIGDGLFIGETAADVEGVARLDIMVPMESFGQTVLFQAMVPDSCRASGITEQTFDEDEEFDIRERW